MQPKIQLRYAKEKPSFVSAVFCLESDNDFFGWYLYAMVKRFSAGFFMIENFYSNNATVLYRSIDNDLHGRWTIDHPAIRHESRCPVPEPVSHELERIQSQLLNEWLFFPNDPGAAPELAAYQHHGLVTHAVNIKCRKLNRLDRAKPEWIHTTPGMDLNVIEFLREHWRIGPKTVIDLDH